MEITLLEVLNRFGAKASGDINVLRSYASYLRERSSSYQRFAAEAGGDPKTTIGIVVPHADGGRVVALTRAAYQRCVSGQSDVEQLTYNSAGDTIDVKADDIVDGLANAYSECAVQAEFAEYCVDTEAAAFSKSQFVSNTLTIVPGATVQVVRQCADFIQSGGPLQSLRAWIEHSSETVTVVENEFIDVTNPDNYAGNPILACLGEIKDDIVSFFSGIEFNVKALKDFFADLWDAATDVFAYILKLFNPGLTTRFETVRSDCRGIIDLPIMQCTFDKTAMMVDFAYTFSTPRYSINPNIHFKEVGVLSPFEAERVYDNLTSVTVDGKQYSVIFSYILPGAKGINFLVQVGETRTHDRTIQVFPSLDGTYKQPSEDHQVASDVAIALRAALRSINDIAPMGRTDYAWQSFDSTLDSWVNALASPSSDREYYECFPAINVDYSSASGEIQTVCKWLMYVAMKIFVSNGFYADNAADNVFWQYAEWVPAAGKGDEVVMDGWTADDLNNVFLPYLRDSASPVALHYQTKQEAGSEIFAFAGKLLLTGVATVAAIKTIKFRKKLKFEAQVADARKQALLTKYALDPTDANLASLKEATKASKRKNLLGRVFGLTSRASSEAATYSAANGDDDSFKQEIMSVTSQVRTLITGPVT